MSIDGYERRGAMLRERYDRLQRAIVMGRKSRLSVGHLVRQLSNVRDLLHAWERERAPRPAITERLPTLKIGKECIISLGKTGLIKKQEKT